MPASPGKPDVPDSSSPLHTNGAASSDDRIPSGTSPDMNKDFESFSEIFLKIWNLPTRKCWPGHNFFGLVPPTLNCICEHTSANLPSVPSSDAVAIENVSNNTQWEDETWGQSSDVTTTTSGQINTVIKDNACPDVFYAPSQVFSPSSWYTRPPQASPIMPANDKLASSSFNQFSLPVVAHGAYEAQCEDELRWPSAPQAQLDLPLNTFWLTQSVHDVPQIWGISDPSPNFTPQPILSEVGPSYTLDPRLLQSNMYGQPDMRQLHVHPSYSQTGPRVPPVHISCTAESSTPSTSSADSPLPLQQVLPSNDLQAHLFPRIDPSMLSPIPGRNANEVHRCPKCHEPVAGNRTTVNKHLQEVHFPSTWHSEREEKCILDDCYDRMVMGSMGRHITDKHFESATQQCQLCLSIFSRLDSFRRHLRQRSCLKVKQTDASLKDLAQERDGSPVESLTRVLTTHSSKQIEEVVVAIWAKDSTLKKKALERANAEDITATEAVERMLGLSTLSAWQLVCAQWVNDGWLKSRVEQIVEERGILHQVAVAETLHLGLSQASELKLLIWDQKRKRTRDDQDDADLGGEPCRRVKRKRRAQDH